MIFGEGGCEFGLGCGAVFVEASGCTDESVPIVE